VLLSLSLLQSTCFDVTPVAEDILRLRKPAYGASLLFLGLALLFGQWLVSFDAVDTSAGIDDGRCHLSSSRHSQLQQQLIAFS